MRLDEKIGRGQTIRTESMSEREKSVTGPGRKASFRDIPRGDVRDISHSITSGGKVTKIGKE